MLLQSLLVGLNIEQMEGILGEVLVDLLFDFDL
jgi:hypothetical protein